MEVCARSIGPKESGVAFVCLKKPPNKILSGAIGNTLKFITKDLDSDHGDEDEYALEDIDVSERDFMLPMKNINLIQFKREWDALGDSVEAVKKYALASKDLQGMLQFISICWHWNCHSH